jgi:hypothetical protein
MEGKKIPTEYYNRAKMNLIAEPVSDIPRPPASLWGMGLSPAWQILPTKVDRPEQAQLRLRIH